MTHNIKEYRQQAGLSQTQLATASNVSVGTIRDWEQGRNVPRDVYQVYKVAVALNTTIEELLNLKDTV